MNDLETHKSKMKKLVIYLNNYKLRKYETFFSYKIFIMAFYSYDESRTVYKTQITRASSIDTNSTSYYNRYI